MTGISSMVALLDGLGGPAGFGENRGPTGDDTSTGPIDLTPVFPDGLTFFGETYDRLWINSNGNLTLNGPFRQYSPEDITTLSTAGLYPFWSDIDVGNPSDRVSPGGASTGSNAIWYDLDPDGGAFTVTWDDVVPFNGEWEEGNEDSVVAFQIRLVDLSREDGRLPGDFRAELRYEAVEWTSGIAGLDGALARVGFTIGDGESLFELPASGDDARLRDLPDRGVLAFTFDAFGLRQAEVDPPIQGTDGDDLLIGTDEADGIVSGLGRDTIQPGLGADEIILRGGSKIISGTAEELLGDTLRGAFWDDTLFFAGESFDASAVTVSETGRSILFDLDGDGAADGSIASDRPISGGSFLTAEVNGGTFVSYIRALPEPEEGRAVRAPERFTGDGVTEGYLTGDGAAGFRVTVEEVRAEAPGAALGVYEIDRDGALIDARLLTAEAEAGTTLAVDGIEAGHRLGLFVLSPPDGEAPEVDPDAFAFVNQLGQAATLADRNYVLPTLDGEVVGADLFHAFAPGLNRDLQPHALVGRDPDASGLTLAFETEMFARAGDFVDLVLTVERVAADVI
jgi:hypothetical protein